MIDGDNQKNRQAIVYPVVTDLSDFLKQTPEHQREGYVFNPYRFRRGVCRRVDTLSNWIVDVGKAAGVKVDSNGGRYKYASAYDFRRAFGTRWANIVPPGILKELMRHSNIETTMSFYVNITANNTFTEVRRHLNKLNRVTKDASVVTNEVTNED